MQSNVGWNHFLIALSLLLTFSANSLPPFAPWSSLIHPCSKNLGSDLWYYSIPNANALHRTLRRWLANLLTPGVDPSLNAVHLIVIVWCRKSTVWTSTKVQEGSHSLNLSSDLRDLMRSWRGQRWRTKTNQRGMRSLYRRALLATIPSRQETMLAFQRSILVSTTMSRGGRRMRRG